MRTRVRLGAILAIAGLAGLGTLFAVEPAAARVQKIRAIRSFPYDIGEPGTYVLESTVAAPTKDTTVIRVLADDVTIDLGGFTISGPGISGSGVGIDAGGRTNVRVIGGTVRGMGSDGVVVGDNSRVERVTATGNGGSGISGGSGVIVESSVASGNQAAGIAVGFESIVTASVTVGNGTAGVLTDDSSIVSRVVASNNGSGGFLLGDACLLVQAVSSFNASSGVYFFDGSSGVLDSVVKGNALKGIDANGSFAYGQSVLTTNNGGNASPQVEVGGLELTENQCGADLTCP